MAHLYLTGISGSGKTSIGRIIADRFGLPFYDTDEEIAMMTGMPIHNYVAEYDWIAFRLREREALQNIINRPNGVVALGGGTLLNQKNLEFVKETGTTVFLNVSPEIIGTRVFQSEKLRYVHCTTLQDTIDAAKQLHEERDRTFLESNILIEVTDMNEIPQETAERVIEQTKEYLLEIGSKHLGSSLQNNQGFSITPVTYRTNYHFCNGNLMSKLHLWFQTHPFQNVFVITDTNVHSLYSTLLVQSIPHSINVKEFIVPAGEDSKSWTMLEKILQWSFEHQIERGDLLIGFGGGVVTDICGFVASIVLRGIQWIAIPTTIIGISDASLGGKTAINHPLGKNIIGAFYPPIDIFFEHPLTTTLPFQEIQSGWGEVVKYGLLVGGELWREITTSDFTVVPNDTILYACIQYKKRVTELDLLEKNERKLLNLGHTAGHALELATRYQKISHGEAVLWGLGVMLEISRQQRGLKNAEYERVKSVLSTFILQRINCSTDDILTSLKSDKKNKNKLQQWVLLEGIGNPILNQVVPEDRIHEVITRHLHYLEHGKVIQ